MKNFNLFREQIAAKSFLMIAEKEMTSAQMKKREEIAQSMDDEDFKKRYGKDWMSVKMATATKQAMKEEADSKEEFEEVYNEHWCAKHVYHDVFGEGIVLEGEHAVPDDDGNIEWYTVEFPHGKETVFTEDVKIMHERMHGHMMKKKKMGEAMHPMKKKMGEAKLHPNQQQLDVHEPEKDELTAKDFEMLRKIKKTRTK